jgi:hypothetical protein
MEKYAIRVNFPQNKALDNKNFTTFSKENIPRNISAGGLYLVQTVNTSWKYGKYLKYLRTK